MQMPEKTGLVFSRHAPSSLPSWTKPCASICKALGAARATPHDLRRTHGSTVTAMGFGREAMDRIQNHKEGGIASVYDRHQYADENKRVMEAVAAKIMALINGDDDEQNNIIQAQFKRA